MQLMSNRKIAYILTLVCYREVECWEQYHTEHKNLIFAYIVKCCLRSELNSTSIFLSQNICVWVKMNGLPMKKAHAAGTGLYAWLCLLRRKYS